MCNCVSKLHILGTPAAQISTVPLREGFPALLPFATPPPPPHPDLPCKKSGGATPSGLEFMAKQSRQPAPCSPPSVRVPPLCLEQCSTLSPPVLATPAIAGAENPAFAICILYDFAVSSVSRLPPHGRTHGYISPKSTVHTCYLPEGGRLFLLVDSQVLFAQTAT